MLRPLNPTEPYRTPHGSPNIWSLIIVNTGHCILEDAYKPVLGTISSVPDQAQEFVAKKKAEFASQARVPNPTYLAGIRHRDTQGAQG